MDFQRQAGLPQPPSGPGQTMSAFPSSTGQQQEPQPTSDSAFDSSIPKAPTLSLPKGGGSIHGMGEKFDVNLSNGTATVSLPIPCTAGRADLQPDLGLTYDSGSGNGPFGLGWTIAHPQITRKADKGLPCYNDGGSDTLSDVYLLSSAEDLVPVFQTDSKGQVVYGSNGAPSIDESIQNGYLVRRYRPRIETSFDRVERWTNSADQNDIHWRTVSAKNITTIFGSSGLSRLYDPSAKPTEPARIWSWLVAEVYDGQGNAMIYNYKPEDSSNISLGQAHEANRSDTTRSANRYLKSIQYCNSVPNRLLSTWVSFSAFSLPQDAWKFSIVFDYGEHDTLNPKPNDSGLWACRQDPFSDYHPGFELRTYRLCKRILMFHHFSELSIPDYLVRSIDFAYNENPTATYLTLSTQSGYTWNAASNTYFKQSLPPVAYEYSLFPTDAQLSSLTAQDVDEQSLTNLPVGLDGTNYQFIDLYGEGISGVLTDQDGAWYYAGNSSTTNFADRTDTRVVQAKFDALEIVSLKPSIPVKDGHFGDVSGAGNVDLIEMGTGAWGYYEWTQDGGWASFQTFQTFSNIDQKNKDVKFIDLTGDGLADILIDADQVYTWYPSLGAGGYGPGQTVTQPASEGSGPICVYADAESTIYLADMSGDGLTDIVRIRNGDVCYWPNTGYGTFGALIQMDDAPSFDNSDGFDQKRIFLADIDGSGTADILYLGTEGVDMYLNQAGNSFSDRKPLSSFPPLDNISVVNAIDLLGNGTTCLVWSSALPGAYPASIRYLDLMQGRKPHLMTRIVNNLGTETNIQYAPSTKFYLQDKQDGHPWLTRLPFPVQCVEKVETFDLISGNRFIRQYSYHHGFFDGYEREFRGFGRVEQLDTDDFASMSKIGSTNIDSSWHVPPVLTKTWFHTGMYIDEQTVSLQMASEYFGASVSGNGQSNQNFYKSLLDDTILPTSSLNGDQQREACRALKGRVLRTEMYANDGSAKADIPYTVNETNFTIVAIQPVQDAHFHGIYSVHPRESILYHYERNVEDPRVQHDLVLDIDQFGNVLKSLKVAYGRNPGKSPLSGNDKTKQETSLLIYSENDYTNNIDAADYRLPLLAEARQYELSGIKPSPTGRYQFTDLTANSFNAILNLPEVPYEANSNSVLPQKRLTKRSRILFRKDDLSGLLPVGQLQPMALPGISYELTFTPGLITKIFQNLLSNPQSVLGGVGNQQGGYVDLNSDGNWWKQSNRISYSINPSISAAQELSTARSSFFVPQSFIDPFQNVKTATYDNYFLAPVSTTDAVGNTVTANLDYRIIQPEMITSENGNRIAAAFDAMGQLSGTAVMGKISESLGDSLTDFQGDLSDTQLDQFFASPTIAAATVLLGNATTRTVYDLGRYWRSGSAAMPVYTAVIARESHSSDPVPAGGLKIQLKFTYSDGFGRAIQTKAYTKSGPLIDQGPIVANRWVGSGWTIFNNKGKPVKQYENFFDDTHDFEFNLKTGVTPILFYDPVMRVIATLRADHAIEKVVFDPWSQVSYDTNDNVLLSDPKTDPDIGHYFDLLPSYEYLPSWYDARASGQKGAIEQNTAKKTAVHSNTPRTTHLDPLGRAILVIDDNGTGGKFSSRTDFDIQDNKVTVMDALNRIVSRYDYSVCRDLIHQTSMEAGEDWYLNDVQGQGLLKWNNRGFRFRFTYDPARRPLGSWFSQNGLNEINFEQSVYGELSPAAQQQNLRGKIWQLKDQAGVSTSNQYDFKGNLVDSARQFAVDYKNSLDWSNNVPVEAETLRSMTAYDALNRPFQTTTPHSSVIYRFYNQTGHLDKTFVNLQGTESNPDPSTWSPIITNVDYNEKDQVSLINYGNGSVTTRKYDPLLFRLQRIQTSRTSTSGDANVQDLNYTYDPTGNITHITDNAQQAIWFRNNRVDPSCDYTYDPIYRLTVATGREHLGQTNGQPSSPTAPSSTDSANTSILNPSDGNAMGSYTESYVYDAVSNILSVSHAGNDPKNPGWKRIYTYGERSLLEPGKISNRLSSTMTGSTQDIYKYDGSAGLRGSITAMPHLSAMQWNYKDQLQSTSKQNITNGGIPETTYYVYDTRGQRVRKVCERQSGAGSAAAPTKSKERIYLPEYEIFRKYDGTGTNTVLERTTLSVINDVAHTAYIETRTIGTDDGAQLLTRYQLNNQLESSCIELDDQGRILSYEEYFPYGSTSYQAVANQLQTPKRYRYTGKEMDDENGFYYCETRYYASWLGRWTSCDTAGLVDGLDVYIYTKANPIKYNDPKGTQTVEPSFPPEKTAPYAEDDAALAKKMKLTMPEYHPPGLKGEITAPELTVHDPGPITPYPKVDMLPRLVPYPPPLPIDPLMEVPDLPSKGPEPDHLETGMKYEPFSGASDTFKLPGGSGFNNIKIAGQVTINENGELGANLPITLNLGTRSDQGATDADFNTNLAKFQDQGKKFFASPPSLLVPAGEALAQATYDLNNAKDPDKASQYSLSLIPSINPVGDPVSRQGILGTPQVDRETGKTLSNQVFTAPTDLPGMTLMLTFTYHF